jgi:uncharacterized protein
MPLLSLLVGIHIATPLVALNSLTISLVILVRNWRKVEVPAAWRLILAALVGIPFGLLLLQRVPEGPMLMLLGAVLITYSLYSLFTIRLPHLQTERSAYIFGFIAGILGGAYNTMGPPIVVYGNLRQWPPDRFRVTLQSFFLFTLLLILAGHGLSGLWTEQVWRYYALATPLVILATFVGGYVNRHLPQAAFRRAIYVVLIGLGLLIISRGFAG